MRLHRCLSVASAVILVACGGDGATTTSQQDASAGADAGSSDATLDQSGDDASDAPADSVADTQADAFMWPTCNTKPASATPRTIPQVWTDDPVAPTEVWISGASVTAISKSACAVGQACQIFLQADLGYASLAAGAHHGIKLFVSAATATYFTGLAVGDRVDALGWAWRYTRGGQHELLVEVNLQLPGCAKKTGTGTATPITGVTLADITVGAYEDTIGPLLVQVADVSGKPALPAETFGLYPTGFDGGFPDGGASIVSLSPYFLPGGAFTGLTTGMTTHFTSITGVFGLFIPATDAAAMKYLEIYPRTMADVVKQ